MRDVAVIGVGMIQFGRRDEDSLMDMLAYASLKALDDAGLGDRIGGCGLRRQHGRGHAAAPDRHGQLAGRPAEPAAGRRRDRGKRPGFRRLGDQERPAGGGFRLLRYRSGGRRREDARGHRLAGDRFRRHHDPPAGRVSLWHHPARHGGHVHPPVHGKIRGDPRDAGGGGAQEPGDGRAATPMPMSRWRSTKDGIFDEPARDRQQPAGGRPAAPVRRLPGQRWRGGGGALPAG